MSGPVAFLARQDGTLEAHEPLMTCDACDLAELCGPDYPCQSFDADEEAGAYKQIADWKSAKE